MRFKTLFSIILVFFLFCSVAFTTEQKMNLNLSAAAVENLDIQCGAGFLKITGVAGLDKIEVKAAINVKGLDMDKLKSFIEENITLTLEKKGDRATLISKIKSPSVFRWKSMWIDLQVWVPKKLALNIKDGSGEIVIKNIGGKLALKDGSGDISLGDVFNETRIIDGSGSLILESIKGNLKIRDGSGEIKIKNVTGDITLKDGSGSIEIFKVNGSVEIWDGSGSILIDGVEKDVNIHSAGSGGVEVKNIKGKYCRKK